MLTSWYISTLILLLIHRDIFQHVWLHGIKYELLRCILYAILLYLYILCSVILLSLWHFDCMQKWQCCRLYWHCKSQSERHWGSKRHPVCACSWEKILLNSSFLQVVTCVPALCTFWLLLSITPAVEMYEYTFWDCNFFCWELIWDWIFVRDYVGSRPSDHYFRSVCWFVCLSVCLCSFSQPSLIWFRSN